MIVHQAIAMQEKVIALADFTEDAEKVSKIILMEKDMLLGISPGGNMIEGSGELDTQWSGHVINITL